MNKTHWTYAVIGAVSMQAVAMAESPTIAQIAPPDAIAVIGVDDFESMHESLDASFLGELWHDQEMQDWFERLLDENGVVDEFSESGAGELLDAALERAGMEREELSMPTGSVGATLWWGMDTDTEEIGPRWIMVCDFGDAGDDMLGFLEAMMEVADDEDGFAVTDDEYEGAETWLVTYVEPEAQNDDAMGDEDDWDEWEDTSGPPLDHAHVGWIDSTLVIAGDRGALERAINRIDGVAMDSLADADVFAQAMRQNDGAELYAAGFVSPMLEAWIPDEMEIGFSMEPILDAIGITGLRSMSAGVRFDGPGGAIEQTYGVVAPEKKGLVKLFDTKMDAFTPPSLVNADAGTVYMVGFDWAGVMPLLNQVIGAIPDEQMRMQAQMSMGMFAGGVGPLLEAMGPEVVIVDSLSRPFSPTSRQIFSAFTVRDNDAISNGINAMSPMLGFEPRDFLGNQIWESQMGAAMGLGFGRLFLGVGEQVEDAMRQAGQGGAVSLADDQAFRNATASLRGGGMLYSFQNNREAYDYAVWTAVNMDAILRAQYEDFGMDEETINMILEEQADSNPFGEVGMPPSELIFRHIGEHAVFEMHSTDDGFRGRSVMFPASDHD